MSEGLNRAMLLGNLGADPELRYTPSGQAVLNIRLATTETWFDKTANERKERTDWHNVVLWGKRAEALSKILTKGSTIFVEGSIRTSSYEDRDGVKRYKTDINASNIILSGSRRAAADGGASQGAGAPRAGGYGRAPGVPPAAAPADEGGGGYGSGDDDIPF